METTEAAASARLRTTALFALGLVLTPACMALALVVAPRLSLGETGAAFTSFALAAGMSLGAVALVVSAEAPLVFQAIACGCAIALLAACKWMGVESKLTFTLVDTALVALAASLGGSIGKRIEHPGHLLPACVVAACADFVSVVSPSGPSHAIVANEHALTLVTVAFPVPGTTAVSPAIGVGDLVFVALVLAAARAHALPFLRSLFVSWSGAMCAVAVSFWLARPVPALPAIATLLLAALPAARRLRSKDRSAAFVGMGVAVAVCLGTAASRYLAP